MPIVTRYRALDEFRKAAGYCKINKKNSSRYFVLYNLKTIFTRTHVVYSRYNKLKNLQILAGVFLIVGRVILSALGELSGLLSVINRSYGASHT